MAVQSIGSIINSGFIRSFQGLASSGQPSIGARAGEGATVSTGLRFGARTFATAIQNLNATIGVVNVADSTLKRLDKIVDKMLIVVDRATSLSAGTETRRVLQSDFENLGKEFRRIVDGSELSGTEFLTQDGLSSLFERIGLSKGDSDGVAAVFRQFLKNGDNTDLASEETKGRRPAEIPAVQRSRVTQLSDSAIATGGGLSANYGTYTDTNGAAFTQPYNVDVLGAVTAQAGVTQNQTILAVNESKGASPGETTGYTLVSSTQDLTGQNPSGYSQVFLVAPDGSAVRQVTNIAVPGVSILAADISADNLTAVVSANDGVTTTVSVISVADISDPPASSTLDESFVADATEIKLSNNGQYIAYKGSGLTNFKQVGGATDTYLGTSFANLQEFGFADSDTLLFRNAAGNEVYSYNFSSSTASLVLTDASITHLTTLEIDSTYSVNDGSTAGIPRIAAFATVSATAVGNKLTVVSYDLNSDTSRTRFRRDIGAGTVDSISLAYQDDLNTNKDRIDVGVIGTLSSLYQDSDREMYRITESRFATNNSLFSSASAEPTDLLDGNVLTRADAYRLKGDLKALKDQIKENVSALANAREYIADNVSLVRTAGFAFLNVSDLLQGTEDAAEVARLVASEIRKNATTAQLAQAENLRNIASVTVGLLES